MVDGRPEEFVSVAMAMAPRARMFKTRDIFLSKTFWTTYNLRCCTATSRRRGGVQACPASLQHFKSCAHELGRG